MRNIPYLLHADICPAQVAMNVLPRFLDESPLSKEASFVCLFYLTVGAQECFPDSAVAFSLLPRRVKCAPVKGTIASFLRDIFVSRSCPIFFPPPVSERGEQEPGVGRQSQGRRGRACCKAGPEVRDGLVRTHVHAAHLLQ